MGRGMLGGLLLLGSEGKGMCLGLSWSGWDDGRRLDLNIEVGEKSQVL